jgi:MFS family permease
MGRPSEELELEQDAVAVRRGARVGRALRGLAVDITPLRRSRDYRLLWFGLLVSETGHQITHVAVLIQVYALTRSAFALGTVGLVMLVSLGLSTILGGPITDAFDRRKVLLTAQVLQAGASGLLLVGALMGHPPIVLVYAGVALMAAVGGIDTPTRNAMMPNLVGKDLLPQAIALGQVMWNTALIAGPAIGGLLVQHFNFSWAYGVDAVTYGAVFLAVLAMRPMPPERSEGARATGVAAIREGFAYLRGRRILQSTFAIDLVAMIFGMPRVLFPVLALHQFHRGPAVVGYLVSAFGVGALLGALTTGWVSRVRRQGLAVIVAVAVWGAAIALFGFSGRFLWVAFVLLAVAGAADLVSAVFRSTILQLTVPDSLRGRLNGIHILVVAGGPRIGDFEAGIVAALFTPMISIVSGGLACLVGVAVLAMAVPEFVRYKVGDPG